MLDHKSATLVVLMVLPVRVENDFRVEIGVNERVIFGQDEIRREERGDDAFVDADFNTENLFDSNGQDHENDQSDCFGYERSTSPLSEIPMDVCPEEHISQPSRDEKKPQAEVDSFRKQAKRRKKRTLLQRIQKKR